MQTLRTVETRLAMFTLFAACVFAPIETIASWQMFGGAWALVHPGYLGSVAGVGSLSADHYIVAAIASLVLLIVGAIHSLRARPLS